MTYTISICKAASLMAFVAQLAVSREFSCVRKGGECCLLLWPWLLNWLPAERLVTQLRAGV